MSEMLILSESAASTLQAYRITAPFLAGYPSNAPSWAISIRNSSPSYVMRLAIGSWFIRGKDGDVFVVDDDTKKAHPNLRNLRNDTVETWL